MFSFPLSSTSFLSPAVLVRMERHERKKKLLGGRDNSIHLFHVCWAFPFHAGVHSTMGIHREVRAQCKINHQMSKLTHRSCVSPHFRSWPWKIFMFFPFLLYSFPLQTLRARLTHFSSLNGILEDEERSFLLHSGMHGLGRERNSETNRSTLTREDQARLYLGYALQASLSCTHSKKPLLTSLLGQSR